MKRILFLLCVLLLVPGSLSAAWMGEHLLGGSYNPLGAAYELSLFNRLDFSNKQSFLLSEAHLDLGGFLSFFVYGMNTSLKVTWSPLLFMELGGQAGLHTTWMYQGFATSMFTYSEKEREALTDYGFKVIPYVNLFGVLQAKAGPVILYNLFSFDKFFNNEWWYYWYLDVLFKDGWLYTWTGVLLLELGGGFSLMGTAHYLYATDSKETKFCTGPGFTWEFSKGWTAALFVEQHIVERNFDGVKVTAFVSHPFSFQ